MKQLPEFDKIYVFEPNPTFYSSYDGSNFTLIKKAIWTEACTLPFYVSKDANQVASSILQEKLCKVNAEIRPFFYETPIEVECVDFSEWIKENIKPYDNLTVKLDIEGAEYDVLWKLIKDGTISYIKKLYVEFHSTTVPGKEEIEKLLRQELENCGVFPHHWD